jgi:hypothetical protein
MFNSSLDLTNGCSSFYTTNFGLTETVAGKLCDTNVWNITTFDFSDPLKTSKALMNIYWNNATLLPSNYADLVFLT